MDTSRLKEDEMVKRRQKRKYEILQEESIRLRNVMKKREMTARK